MKRMMMQSIALTACVSLVVFAELDFMGCQFAVAQVNNSQELSLSDIRIEQADDGFEPGEPENFEAASQAELGEINRRSDEVSRYGTFSAVQKPVEWSGQAFDLLVSGIAQMGSALVYYPAKLFEKKDLPNVKGGNNGSKEKGEKEETRQKK